MYAVDRKHKALAIAGIRRTLPHSRRPSPTNGAAGESIGDRGFVFPSRSLTCSLRHSHQNTLLLAASYFFRDDGT
jgi:hypothetical protein